MSLEFADLEQSSEWQRHMSCPDPHQIELEGNLSSSSQDWRSKAWRKIERRRSQGLGMNPDEQSSTWQRRVSCPDPHQIELERDLSSSSQDWRKKIERRHSQVLSMNPDTSNSIVDPNAPASKTSSELWNLSGLSDCLVCFFSFLFF